MKHSILCVVTAALSVLILACDAGQRVPTGRQGSGTRPAVIGVIADLQSWNPYLAETAFNEDLLTLIYPSLATELTDYAEHPPGFAPSLASSWEFSEDRHLLTFHLRHEASWSDGIPVTSQDVVFTWKTQLDTNLGWTGVFVKDAITNVEAVDDHTVRFTFDRVYPYQLMDANDGLIVPAHAWAQFPYADWHDVDWEQHVLSAGPFQLARHTPQQEIVLTANPSYWAADRPRLDRVVWRIVPSQTSLMTVFRSGALDFINRVAPTEVDSIRQAPATDVTVYPDRTYTFVGWNTALPLLTDAAVRRALTMAIDRQRILDSVRRGFGRIAVGPVLSTMWAFNRDLQPLPHDPGRAVELLSEAGWKDSDGDGTLDRNGVPFELELLTNSENQERRDICVLVAEDLARVGVKVTPRFLEWGTVVARQERGDFDAFVAAWREPTQVDLEDIWHTAPPEVPTSNYVRYSSEEVDELVERVGEEPDFVRQKPLLDRIQELVVADQPYTFLYERHQVAGISTRVVGAEINDATPYFNLEEWQLKE